MPSHDIRVAVVGCGYWGRNLVRNFAELGALEALVDVSQKTVDELAAKHGGRAATYAEVLKSKAVDAVVIAAPEVGHLLQYHPAFLKLKELLRDGELGRLH